MCKETWPPRCHFCNRFMSYKNMATESMRWTPYGDTSMEEPPPEEYAHLSCWQDVGANRRKLIESIAWAKPYTNKEGE